MKPNRNGLGSVALLVLFGLGLSSAVDAASPADKRPKRVNPALSIQPLANPGSQVMCYGHVHRCVIPVYVHALANGECSAWLDPEKVLVPKVKPQDTQNFGHTKVRVVWVLRRGDGGTDLSEFSFDSSQGVKLLDNTQPTNQFVSEGWDGDYSENPNPEDSTVLAQRKKRFRWASTHVVTGVPVRYDLVIYRKTEDTHTCSRNDPIIINTD